MAQMSSKRSVQSPCGLLVSSGTELAVFGGAKLGFETSPGVTAVLSYGRPALRKPNISVTLCFDRQLQDHTAFFDHRGQPCNSYSIVLKFLPGCFKSSGRALTQDELSSLYQRKPDATQFTVLELTATNGHMLTIEGIGLPFTSAADGEVSFPPSSFLNNDMAFGTMKLLDLCRQERIRVLVRNMAIAQIADSQFRYYIPAVVPQSFFPYSDGDWDMARYKREIMANSRDKAYADFAKLDTKADRLTCVTQCVVQEVFWLAEDAKRIRSCEVRCLFLKLGEQPDNVASEFKVMVWYGSQAQALRKSLSVLVAGGSTIGLAFTPHALDSYWQGVPAIPNEGNITCDLVLKIRRPNKRQDPGDPNQAITAYASPMEGVIQGGFYLVLDAGVAVARRRVEAANDFFQDTENMMSRLQQEFVIGHGFPSLLQNTSEVRQHEVLLPNMLERFWENSDDAVRDQMVVRMGHQTVTRFQKYLKVPRLAYLVIIGVADSVETELAALVALMLITGLQYERLYCTAPTDAATSKFAQKLSKMAADVDAMTNKQHKTGRLPMVVRGYAISCEVESFIATVGGATALGDVYTHEKWSMELSVCQWMLKVVGFGKYKLDPRDSPALEYLHRKYSRSTEPKYRALRRFVAREIDFNEFERSQLYGSNALDAITDIAIEVLRCADALCTTPYHATDPVYREWNQTRAKATVLYEAGAMPIADALCTWLNDGRPVVMAGDMGQFPPAAKNAGAVCNGRLENPFSLLGRVSILHHAKSTHWPCFVVDKGH